MIGRNGDSACLIQRQTSKPLISGEDYVEYHQVDSRIRARCQRELAILHSVVAGSRYAEKLEGLAAAAGGVDVVEAMAFEYGTV